MTTRKAYVAVYDKTSELGNQGERIIATDAHWTDKLSAAIDAVELMPHEYAQGWYSDGQQVTCMAFKRG